MVESTEALHKASLTDAIRAAQCYLQAALIALNAPVSQAAVRRVFDRGDAVPEEDEDYRQMVENPAKHWFGWDKAPSTWPDGFEWDPSPLANENIEKAHALIEGVM